ncbi:MAG: hypothetical protein WCQ95_09230 [Bacteroidota bacterium]
MRILLIITRVLFFLSFFFPFILLPQCQGPSAEEKASKELAMMDSVRRCDSVNKVYHITDSCSIIKLPCQAKPYETQDLKDNSNKNFSGIHSFLKSPIKNSISGYGIALISISKFDFKLESLVWLLISLSFLLSFFGILAIFIKPKHLINTIISLFCFLSLMTVIIYLILIGFTNAAEILWGFWTSLFLSLTNVIITIIIRRKNTSR